MNRILRTVSREIWRVNPKLSSRRERLLDGEKPEDLIDNVHSEAIKRARDGEVKLEWEHSEDSPGFFRLWTQIQLSEDTFDQLFNGCAGYRAQYYLSPKEGILFNRDVVDGLLDAIRFSYKKSPLQPTFSFIEKSLLAPHSKIWFYNEKEAFDTAAPEILNPPRWVKNNATRGRKAPLPEHLKVDLKGTFINPETGEFFIDEFKLDRACDLFEKGYT